MIIELYKRRLPKSMVHYNVNYHGYAPAVRLIDKSFQSLLCAIVLIGCKHKRGIVAPALIALKLVNGHKFNGINIQPVEVIQCVEYGIVIVHVNKITYQQLINDKIILRRFFIIGIVPVELLLGSLENTYYPIRFSYRIWFQVRVDIRRYIFVIPRIKHLLGIWVGNRLFTIHNILKCILFTGGQSCDGNPIPGVGICFICFGNVHQVIIAQHPVVEISFHINIRFIGCMQHEGDFGIIIRIIVYAVTYACRQIGHRCCGIYNHRERC